MPDDPACPMILGQIGELTNTFNTLNATYAANLATANSAYGTILASDNGYGGTYPGLPLTSGNIQTRIDYLQGLATPPAAVILMYRGLKAFVVLLEGTAAAMGQTVALLGEWKDQATEHGCQQ